jgi:hypothetical protein
MRRLAWVSGRLASQVQLGSAGLLSMADLDEALFPLPGLLNFQAAVTKEQGIDFLQVTLFTQGGPAEKLCRSTRLALETIPALQKAIEAGSLKIAPLLISEQSWLSSGSIKRTIYDKRERKTC